MKRCNTCDNLLDESMFPRCGGVKRPHKRRTICKKCYKAEYKQKKKDKTFTEEFVTNKITSNDTHAIRQSPRMVKRVMNITSGLPANGTWKQRIFHVRAGHNNVEMCKECNTATRMFMDYKRAYSDFCCKECSKIWHKREYDIRCKDKMKRYNKRHPHIYAWRSVLQNALVRLKQQKTDRTHNLLGYTADELKNHLENKFTCGMTWDRYGEWHVDHIKAVTSFPQDTPMQVVNALNNLQPLWGPENIAKGKK